jgi:hypothetical protein
MVQPGSVITVHTTRDDGNASLLSIYDTTFHPTNLATDYLGDPGNSSAPTTFSVDAPASGEVVIVAGSVLENSPIGKTFSADITFTATPEPASLTLLGLGVASIAGYAWRRRR